MASSRGGSLLRALPGFRLRYQLLDRLGAVQRELRQVHKRLVKLEGRHEITVPSVPDRDERFLAVAEGVAGRTSLDEDRLWVLWQAVRNVAPLGLPFLEAGTYKGGSARFLAQAAVAWAGRELPLDVVDTFEGHPSQAIGAEDHAFHEPGRFGDASYEKVSAYLSDLTQARVHKGAFADVAQTLGAARYALAHLDMDLYRPTADALDFVAARMPAGGVIVVDDFGSPKCPGIAQAVEEFRASHLDFQAWHPHTEQLVLVRVG